MFGNATLSIPASGDIGPSFTTGLSDSLAETIGLTAALCLSDEDGCVIVTFGDGTEKVIGHDDLRGVLNIEHLNYEHGGR